MLLSLKKGTKVPSTLYYKYGQRKDSSVEKIRALNFYRPADPFPLTQKINWFIS